MFTSQIHEPLCSEDSSIRHCVSCGGHCNKVLQTGGCPWQKYSTVSHHPQGQEPEIKGWAGLCFLWNFQGMSSPGSSSLWWPLVAWLLEASPHFCLPLYQVSSPCVSVFTCCVLSSYERIKAHTQDCSLTWWDLQRPNLQTRSQGQVMGVRT